TVDTFNTALKSYGGTKLHTYLRPEVVLTGLNYDNLRIQLSGFQSGAAPTVYWRRPGFGQEADGRTEWTELSTSAPSIEVSQTVFRSKEGNWDGRLGSDLPQVILQVMAVDGVNGEAAGTSTILGLEPEECEVRVNALLEDSLPLVDFNIAANKERYDI